MIHHRSLIYSTWLLAREMLSSWSPTRFQATRYSVMRHLAKTIVVRLDDKRLPRLAWLFPPKLRSGTNCRNHAQGSDTDGVENVIDNQKQTSEAFCSTRGVPVQKMALRMLASSCHAPWVGLPNPAGLEQSTDRSREHFLSSHSNYVVRLSHPVVEVSNPMH
ncbi:hypothetical protein LX32DRAFT_70804 [Colletotrichum zoysiae]|uniref:Uncharacterized protein n=1 Tax=Colletotrichum zoysiae TaxID=1216348 RepID=A0AAD9HB04_9PEZI|nr:hypothetical protein LX32DRAFT_70804 [Colletotrichum zoysiae]